MTARALHRQSPLLDVDPSARRSADFYRTPPYQSRALLARLAPLGGWGGLIVEPCAGDGAIVGELPGDVDILTNDIVARAPLLPDFLLDAREAMTWSAFARCGRIDVVITNPPFAFALALAEQALAAAHVGVCLLLRITWAEPTRERSAWLAAHPPTRVIVLPRHNYRGTSGGDQATTAWFIWAVRPEFCVPGFEVVSLEERARLERVAPPRPPGEAGRELRAEDLQRVRHAQ